MKVREIMSSPAITEDVDAGIIKIASIMEELGVGSVVITAESKPAGIITERDIALKVLLKNKPASEVKAKEIMTSPLILVESDTSVEEASKLAAKSGIKRLPVVDNGVLIGVVSVRNILTLRPEYVKRFYPEVRVLASGWTLDRLEKYLSDCVGFLAREDVTSYQERLKEVYEELSKLVSHYMDDKELKGVFESLGQLYHEHKLPLEEQKKRLELVLRKFRHITYWRKQQTVSSLGAGVSRFHDYRHGTGKEFRLPYKRTR
jgi:CBS domain-containing protein